MYLKKDVKTIYIMCKSKLSNVVSDFLGFFSGSQTPTLLILQDWLIPWSNPTERPSSPNVSDRGMGLIGCKRGQGVVRFSRPI